MSFLKEILGDDYREGISLEEVDGLLSKKKLVDLGAGQYVDRQKYETLKTKYEELKQKSADVESLQAQFDQVSSELEKTKKEIADKDLTERLISMGVSRQYVKYVKRDLEDGTIQGSDDEGVFKKNITSYLKQFPTFASTPTPTPSSSRIVTTSIDGRKTEEDNATQNANADVNANIRNALGRKIIS